VQIEIGNIHFVISEEEIEKISKEIKAGKYKYIKNET